MYVKRNMWKNQWQYVHGIMNTLCIIHVKIATVTFSKFDLGLSHKWRSRSWHGLKRKDLSRGQHMWNMLHCQNIRKYDLAIINLAIWHWTRSEMITYLVSSRPYIELHRAFHIFNEPDIFLCTVWNWPNKCFISPRTFICVCNTLQNKKRNSVVL